MVAGMWTWQMAIAQGSTCIHVQFYGTQIALMLFHVFSEIYLVWLTGIRMLIEGSVLTYFGPEGFK